jgi:hypothetical protein
MFDWMDRNGDGVLDEGDRSPVHQRLADKGVEMGDRGFGERRRGDHHAELDADDDGKLDRAEYVAGAAAMFEELDADSDGVVTPDELDAALEARRKMTPWWRDDG